MHTIVVTTVSFVIAVASLGGFRLEPMVSLSFLVFAVCLVGLPHGGLDHWVGRKLFGERFPRAWWLLFFPAYFSVTVWIGLGWYLIPTVTAIVFFLLSAWHFGMEDEMAPASRGRSGFASVIAIGGLVIWVPSLFRSGEFASLLSAVMPTHLGAEVETTLTATQALAIVAVPIACVNILRDFGSPETRSTSIRNSGFVVLFALTDLVVSFGIYFCGWHSVRGLKRLAAEHEMTVPRAWVSAAPLTFAAVAISSVGMLFWTRGQLPYDGLVRTLFVALSAVAVPHLLLHGNLASFVERRFASTPRCRTPRSTEVG